MKKNYYLTPPIASPLVTVTQNGRGCTETRQQFQENTQAHLLQFENKS